jgi:hypothetical protein
MSPKLIFVGKHLGDVRNAADYGIDPDVGVTWTIRNATGIEYVFLACSFIAAVATKELTGLRRSSCQDPRLRGERRVVLLAMGRDARQASSFAAQSTSMRSAVDLSLTGVSRRLSPGCHHAGRIQHHSAPPGTRRSVRNVKKIASGRGVGAQVVNWKTSTPSQIRRV